MGDEQDYRFPITPTQGLVIDADEETLFDLTTLGISAIKNSELFRQRVSLSQLSSSTSFENDTALQSWVEGEKNQFGYINDEKESIFFSRRNQLTFTNKLLIDYAINTKIFTNIIIRHYWSRFENKDFYILNTDGTLSQSNSSNFDSDINFNSWNIDLTFSYEFLPGSFLSFVWKNQLLAETNILEDSFYNNIMNTFNSPMLNSFSIKATYFLDYNNLKRRK